MTRSESLLRRSSSRKPVASVQWLHTAKKAKAANELRITLPSDDEPYSAISVRGTRSALSNPADQPSTCQHQPKGPREVEPAPRGPPAQEDALVETPRTSPARRGERPISLSSTIPSIVEQTIGTRRSRGDGLKSPDPLRNHDQSEARQIQCDYRRMNRERTTAKVSKHVAELHNTI